MTRPPPTFESLTIQFSKYYSFDFTLYFLYVFAVKPHEKSSSPERNLIGRRTESDWTADANGEKSLGRVNRTVTQFSLHDHSVYTLFSTMLSMYLHTMLMPFRLSPPSGMII